MFFLTITATMIFTTAASQAVLCVTFRKGSLWLLLLCLLSAVSVLAAFFLYFMKQDRILADAEAKIRGFLDGNTEERIANDKEGELYRLFCSVNNLSAVLSAKAAKENNEKVFLKNMISDISHQLKTPLAALVIYNGILEEAEEIEQVREFVRLSARELDRIETLVQNLLKITKLDAGAMVLHKSEESISEIIKDIQLHFDYRARTEGKSVFLAGEDQVTFFCDRDWMTEAVENLVKNALDHTKEGDYVSIEWSRFNSLLQIKVKDNGCGIHPEDLPHIFKRFYRSRFSRDSQGLGLGLSLTKAIVEAHGGTIEVESKTGAGATFTMNFLIPSK
ncbi:MAG: sensor histidine kinase [Anaerovoracaceae bacterium]